jgi:hypothetical protein
VQRVDVERLGDQEGRLRPLAGEQALGEGGDEDDGHGRPAQDLAHRVEARAVVGELDVGQDQLRRPLAGQRHRLLVGGGDAGDRVAAALDRGHDVERDDRLVLDDQDPGRALGAQVGLRLAQQRRRRGRVEPHHRRRLLEREALERGEDQDLPLGRGELLDPRRQDLAVGEEGSSPSAPPPPGGRLAQTSCSAR